jgi:hypothetical protein
VSHFVQRLNAREFRHEILSLFDRNAQPLTAECFDWYYGDNGHATVLSWMLRGSTGQTILGLCSVTPRAFRFGDRSLRAGIVGNLMVDKPSRTIGGLALLRSVQSLVSSGQFDILLGIPGIGAPMRLILRMGFSTIGRWQTYVQISRSRSALFARYSTAGAALSPIADLSAAVWRRLSCFESIAVGNFKVVELTSDHVSKLPAADWPHARDRFCTDFSPPMLESRFLREPLKDRHLLGIVNRQDGSICGYLVVECSRGRTIVYHCRTDVKVLSEADAIVLLCRDAGVHNDVVSVTALRGSALSTFLERSGFLPLPPKFGGDEHSLVGFWRPDDPLARYFGLASNWNVLPGISDIY